MPTVFYEQHVSNGVVITLDLHGRVCHAAQRDRRNGHSRATVVVFNKALGALCAFVQYCSFEHVKAVVDMSAIPKVLAQSGNRDRATAQQVLVIVEAILITGDEANIDVNPFLLLFDASAVERIKRLVLHTTYEIHEHASELLAKYFRLDCRYNHNDKNEGFLNMMCYRCRALAPGETVERSTFDERSDNEDNIVSGEDSVEM